MPTLEQQEIRLLKGRISQLEARVEFLYRHLGVTFVSQAGVGDDSRVIEALKGNNVLQAIKAYRMTTNASLEEAKFAIEEMRGRLGI